MKSRIVSISALLSIIPIFILFVPFKRDIVFRIDKSIIRDLNQVSVNFIRNGIIVLSKDYYFKYNQSQYYSEIRDSIRLGRGEYELKVFLIYQEDNYLTREIKLKINYFSYDDIIVNL